MFFNTAHGTGSGTDTEMSGSAMDIQGIVVITHNIVAMYMMRVLAVVMYCC